MQEGDVAQAGAAALARQALSAERPEAVAWPPGSPDEMRSWAWALKDAAYATIYADLPKAERAGRLTALLADRAEGSELRSELIGLSQWLRGAVDALCGKPSDAVERLDTAYREFVACGRIDAAASCQVPKIAALILLGRVEDSLACASRTLDQLEQVRDERSAGKVELNMGSLLLRQDRYAEASSYYRRASVRFARLSDRQHSVMADIGHASCLCWQFEFDEAERIYDRADARIAAHGLSSLKGDVAANRGMLALHRGRHAEALRWLEASLRHAEGGQQPHWQADAEIELANAYRALNLLPEAESLYARAMATCEVIEAPLEQAWAAARLGQVRASMGAHVSAEVALQRAESGFAALNNLVGLAFVQAQRGRTALRLGAHDEALHWCEQSIDALADSGMRGWWLDARLCRAEAWAGAGRSDLAAHEYAAVLLAAQGLPEVLARGHAGLGVLHREQGRLQEARRSFEAAAGTIEDQVADLHQDEFRTGYRADKEDIYEHLLALALDDSHGATSVELLRQIERSRTLAMGAIVSDEHRGLPVGAGGQAWARGRESLHWLQRQLQVAISTGAEERMRRLKERTAGLERTLLEEQRRWQAARPGLGASAAAAAGTPGRSLPDLDIARLQSRLNSLEVLVEYALLEDRLLIVVVRHDSVHHVVMPVKGLHDAVEGLRFQINSLRYGAPSMVRHGALLVQRAQAHLQTLHRLLWQPILPFVAGVVSAVVVPHRSLHGVPFAALHDGTEALIDRCAVTVAPSASWWLSRHGKGMGTEMPSRAVVLGVAGAELPHVCAEVRAVAAVFGESATVLVDDDARLARLEAAVARADVLHLACHGQFRSDSPYFSSLVLADGPFTLRDAARLQLKGCLVTLSACETGLGHVSAGNEQVGLVRGFLTAGASAVVASLWTVDDASTAELMRSFYSLLRQCGNPAQALREAQLYLRDHHPHPYHWGAFVLHA
jgi:tetratricopeptide (TPR) repeat protein